MERRYIVGIAIAVEGALLLLAWAVGSAWGLSPAQHMAWTWKAAGLGLASTAPMLAAFAVIEFSSWPPLRDLSRLIDVAVLPLFAKCRVSDLAMISLLAGLGEEALFRGVMQVHLTDKLGTLGAIVATAALFGLCHALSLAYALYAALAGALLGAMLTFSGNLLVPILAHATYDFVVLIYLLHFRGTPEPLEA